MVDKPDRAVGQPPDVHRKDDAHGIGLYLTDLEQTLAGGDKAWDLAEFLYYTAKLSNKEEKMKEIAAAFLKGYVSEGEKAAIERARSNRYFAPFLPFLTPGMSGMLREVLEDFS
jgi:hypothetical protein